MYALSTLLLTIFLCAFNVKFSSLVGVSSQEPAKRIIFNGKSLAGWTGALDYWRVENGELIGTTLSKKDPEEAQWIATDQSFSNFELSLWVKLSGDGNRNSGIYYRGQWNEEGQVVGYEFDIGGWGGEKELWWGELHDPYRREDLWIGNYSIDELKSIYNQKDGTM